MLFRSSERVNKLIQKRIEEYLEPLIGANNFIVRVSSEISRKKIEESATTFAEGVVGQEQVGDERLGAGGEGPAVGPAIPGVDSGKNYARSNRTVQKYPSFKQKTVSTPPGRISKISVAVALDSDLLPRVSVKQLKESIAAITSPNTTVDDVKITVAEFARDKGRKAAAGKPSALPNIGGFLSQITAFFQRLPKWASITIAVFGLLILLGSFRKPAPSAESTVSQINQAVQQRQFQRPEAQIGAQAVQPVPEIAAQEPDLSGILSGLKETASEKPEFLANKLQIWLEEGTTAGRI